jgi:hypothetical protein
MEPIMTAKLRRLLIAGTAGSRETEILRAADLYDRADVSRSGSDGDAVRLSRDDGRTGAREIRS